MFAIVGLVVGCLAYQARQTTLQQIIKAWIIIIKMKINVIDISTLESLGTILWRPLLKSQSILVQLFHKVSLFSAECVLSLFCKMEEASSFRPCTLPGKLWVCWTWNVCQLISKVEIALFCAEMECLELKHSKARLLGLP